MAQGDGVLYNNFKGELLKGTIDMDGHTLKLILVSGYTPNIDTHTAYSDVSSLQLSGAGYTSGGESLTTKAVSVSTSSDSATFDADDVTWTSLNAGTPSHAILYNDSHASKALIAYWEVTTPSNGGNYTLQFNASGIITLA